MWFVAVLALFAQAPFDSLRSIEKLIAEGQNREALAALATLPDSAEHRLLASKAHDGLGDAVLAVAEAEAALKFNPGSEAVHLQLGQIFLGHNTPKAALEVFTEALALHPNSYLLHAGRGLALKELLLYDESERELKQCLAAKPGFSVCFDGLATVYLHSQRHDDLRRIAVEHEVLNPRDYRGPYFTAVAGNAAGADPATIEKKLEQAIALNSNFAAAHALRGRLQLQRGEIGLAIVSLEIAVRLRRDYQPALLNLAQAFKRAGRNADAERTYEMLRQANERERLGKPSLLYHRGAK